MYISLKWPIELSQESKNDDGEWKSNWEQVRAQRMAKRYDQGWRFAQQRKREVGRELFWCSLMS